MSHDPPDTINIPHLEYTSCRQRRDKGINTCMIVGAAVLAVLFMVMTSTPSTRRPRYGPRPMRRGGMQYVYSMVSSVGNAISGRAASVMSNTEGYLKPLEAIAPNVKADQVVVICHKNSDKNPEAYKTATDAEKEACFKTATQWLAEHPHAVVALFAPWCQHCHNAMPIMADMSSKHPDIPFAMIDAESLPSYAIGNGEKSIAFCEYFPTILARYPGRMDRMETIDQAAEKVKEEMSKQSGRGSAAPTAAPEAADMDMNDTAEQSTDDMFTSLF